MDAPVSINLRLPRDLHARLKTEAARDRRSLNSEIVWLLDSALNAVASQHADSD
jgi:predicted HicB family RNase H-like nuclease